ncbi:hypothetical protein [Sediminibacillus massiliensis]|uniref:hypothetical protein n=1 Tax=Sediminibacillus massiliensis TaxID=1926277 RepID=UPI00098849B9|nr:hypothetical protein [Sediminibacillus massiliensis]
MNQTTLYDFIEDIPQEGDIIETREGKIRILGRTTTWGGTELMLYADPKNYLKGVLMDEINEWREKL